METKIFNETFAVAKANENGKLNNYILLNNEKIEIKSTYTSLRKFIGYLSIIIDAEKLKKQNVKITLPTGKIVKFNDLHSIKKIGAKLFFDRLINLDDEDLSEQFEYDFKQIQNFIYKAPINWKYIGTDDINEITEIYKQAYQIAINKGLVKYDFDDIKKLEI